MDVVASLVAQLRQGNNRYKLAAALSLLVLYRRSNAAKAAARKKKRALEAARGPPHKVSRAKQNSKAMTAMWALLLPAPFGKGKSGKTQLIAMAGLCIFRIGLMSDVADLIKRLDANMMTRDAAEFKMLFKWAVRNALISTVHRTTYKYVENSLGLIWNRELVKSIHQKYFRWEGCCGAAPLPVTAAAAADPAPLPSSNMNYYHLAQGAASNEAGSIKDPANTITEDAKSVTTQLSLALCEALYSASAGSYFAWRLGRLYGARFAFAPFGYLWVMFTLTSVVAPWGRVIKKMNSLKLLSSAYKEANSRVVQNIEAIAALCGSEVEVGIMKQRFKEIVKATKQYHGQTVWPALCEQFAFVWFVRVFVGFFSLGPHVLFKKEGGRDTKSIAGMAKLRGDLGHQFVLFTQTMIAAGVSAKMLRLIQRVASPAGRVHAFLTKLKEDQTSKEIVDSGSIVPGDCIEFKNVKVVAGGAKPGDEIDESKVLVDDLSFKLAVGSSVLLTGHNGAGKSSIFRCMGGLWAIPTGVITRPGSAESGLHQEVFYLPQRPYNVLGTLCDQLTYPLESKDAAEPVTEEQLRQILRQVDLEHLLNRPDTETNWANELSLGEQQRLAMARLLYHKPKFAVLDECTSAVSGDMEKMLYDICKSMDVTYITISHRPVLKAYHNQLLTIGVDKVAHPRGFTLEEIDHSKLSKSDTTFTPTKALEMTHSKEQSRAANQHRRSEPYQDLATREPVPVRSSLRRFLRLLKMGVNIKSLGLFAAINGGIAVQTSLLLNNNNQMAKMMGAVFAQDRNKFLQLTFTWPAYCVGMCIAEQATLYLKRELALGLRKSITNNFIRRFMADSNFYRMVQIDGRISDPQQRLTADVEKFATDACEITTGLIQPVVEIIWWTRGIRALVGDSATAGVLAYLGVGSVIIRNAMPNFKRLVTQEQELDGKFRFVHSRVCSHSESIAFSGGDERERALADASSDSLLKTGWKKLNTQWKFGMINQLIVREAPMLVQWQLRSHYGNQFKDTDMMKDSGQTVNAGQLYLFNATNYLFESLAKILNFYEEIANLWGLVTRISEFDEVLGQIEKRSRSERSELSGQSSADETDITLEGVDIVTPDGQCLAQKVSLTVTKSTPLMVTGPNACGKTALFRVIGGLWPLRNGNMRVPRAAGSSTDNVKQLFLVPQRMYMASGSLADQITYPEVIRREERTSEKEAELSALLHLVGIERLISRKGQDGAVRGWDLDIKWEDVLSLGEQQRMGMARLFYHRPKFGILDECTSAVSVDVEEKLYIEARERGITMITMSQRLALDQFHTQELRLGEDSAGGWTVHELFEVH